MQPPPQPSAASEIDTTWAYVAWVLSLVATLGSLFLSDVLELPPCSLCWYQRVCLFPLTIILAVGIVLRDPRLLFYGMPLVAVGLVLALYHNLLYYGVIPESLSPCQQGVPCSSRQIDWLGFIGIPLMSLGAFVSIGAALLLHGRNLKRATASHLEPPLSTGSGKWP